MNLGILFLAFGAVFVVLAFVFGRAAAISHDDGDDGAALLLIWLFLVLLIASPFMFAAGVARL